MRGEKGMMQLGGGGCWGSPPHARGKDALLRAHRPLLRITPACAGKRFTHRPNGAAAGDHPRMRGEKPGFFLLSVYHKGSPPHARGKD